MNKRTLLILLSVLSIFMVSCKDGEEKPVIDDTIIEKEIESSNVGKVESFKWEEIGKITRGKNYYGKNLSEKNQRIRFTVDEYALRELEILDEAKKELLDIEGNKVLLLDVKYSLENISGEKIEINNYAMELKTNTDEEVEEALMIPASDDKKLELDKGEVKKGESTVVLESDFGDIKDIEISYDGMTLNLKF